MTLRDADWHAIQCGKAEMMPEAAIVLHFKVPLEAADTLSNI